MKQTCFVCQNIDCQSRGSEALMNELTEMVAAKGIDAEVKSYICFGGCDLALMSSSIRKKTGTPASRKRICGIVQFTRRRPGGDPPRYHRPIAKRYRLLAVGCRCGLSASDITAREQPFSHPWNPKSQLIGVLRNGALRFTTPRTQRRSAH